MTIDSRCMVGFQFRLSHISARERQTDRQNYDNLCATAYNRQRDEHHWTVTS